MDDQMKKAPHQGIPDHCLDWRLMKAGESQIISGTFELKISLKVL